MNIPSTKQFICPHCNNEIIFIENEFPSICNKCKLEFTIFFDELKRDTDFFEIYAYEKKYRLEYEGKYIVGVLPIEKEKLKFPELKKLNDFIDKNSFSKLIKGFFADYDENIFFVEENDVTQIINITRNSDKNKCTECELFFKENIHAYLKNCLHDYLMYPHNESFIPYLCKNGCKRIYFLYPLLIEHVYLGLFVIEVNKFLYDLSRMDAIINKYFANMLIDSAYDQILADIFVQDLDAIKKYDDIFITIKQISILLNKLYVGKIRENNRTSIKLLFKCLYPEENIFTPEFGIDSFKKNLKSVMKYIGEDVFNFSNILFYDNFLIPISGSAIFNNSVSLKEPGSNAKTELILNPKLFDKIFKQSKIILWHSKDIFTKNTYNDDDKTIRKNIILYLEKQLKIEPTFIAFLPMEINSRNFKRAFLLLIDNDNKVVYNNSVMHYFQRFYDILKISLQVYFDQIIKEKQLKRLTHDMRSKSGDIHSKVEDILDEFNDLITRPSLLKRKFNDVKIMSKGLVDLTEDFVNLSNSEYQQIDVFDKVVFAFYSEIYLPILHANLRELHKKEVFIEDYKNELNNLPKMYLNRENFIRAFNNIFFNMVKYSIPKTKTFIRCQKDTETLKISVSNISFRLTNEDCENIFTENYRGTNTQKIKLYNKNINFTPGEGLGLKIAKELITTMKGNLEFEQSNLSETDIKELSFFYRNIEDFSRITFILSIPIRKN